MLLLILLFCLTFLTGCRNLPTWMAPNEPITLVQSEKSTPSGALFADDSRQEDDPQWTHGWRPNGTQNKSQRPLAYSQDQPSIAPPTIERSEQSYFASSNQVESFGGVQGNGQDSPAEFGKRVDIGGSQPLGVANVGYASSLPSTPNDFQIMTLHLGDVLQAVVDHYPEIDIAVGEIEVAYGKYLSSQGAFDRVASTFAAVQPVGIYETQRVSASLNQPLFLGGSVFGSYRIGDGNFEPWYLERETNEAGEFAAGFKLPLWKDRFIDERRAQLFGNNLGIDQVESDVDSRVLRMRRFATQSYWEWVASGAAVGIQKRLLELAESRVDQITLRIERKDLAKIAGIDNDRFIAKRKNDLIKARRQLEKAAIKLSIFWRDENGSPVIAQESQVPGAFPNSLRIQEGQLRDDIAKALSVRPELKVLQAQRQQAQVELDYANNLTLAKIDLNAYAGQDIGQRASSKDDKSDFEVQVGLLASLPLQRREGLGKIQAAQGKLAQIDAKFQFTGDKIRIEVQDAASAVNAAFDQIDQSAKNVELTKEALRLGKIAFDAGDIDLIALNIYETSVADAELQLLDARLKFFFYLAVYENAIRGRAFSDSE